MPFDANLDTTQSQWLSTESNYQNQHGVFYGHVAGGTAFLLCGIIWMLKYSFSSIVQQQAVPPNNAIFHIQKLPIEGLYWFFAGSLALIQIFSNSSFTLNLMTEEGDFIPNNLHEWQHVSLSAPFLLYGCTKIMAETKYPALIGLADPMGIIACGIFGLVMLLHTYAMDPVNAQIHYLLSATSFCTTVSFVTDYALPNNRIPFIIVRAFFMLLQGTWMVQAAFVLEPPNDDVTWDLNDEVTVMFISTVYVWHALCDMAFLALLNCVVQTSLRQLRKSPFVNYKVLSSTDDE
ncbi:Transmembrane protein 45B [Holothuria leucospilota]|uniref:Transmembrane protein 45B n=1 Tax=Holothuria leucospilota TaxID=206669 RepID=A0A9Q1BGA3_HOLLE|nr:Transmembrane protein 45B [Holothuria leucospilota]